MKFKKILILSLLLFSVTSISVLASTENITTSHNGQGQYQYLETVAENQLHANVSYQKDLGQTKTALEKTPTGGTKNAAGQGGGGILSKDLFYGQSINILEGKTNQNMKVVSWGYTTSTRYALRNVVNLALDYERNHPGWKVVGGVNADFFDLQGTGRLPYQSIGPMISDHQVLRASGGHNYSLMLGFKNSGTVNDLVVKKYQHQSNGLDEYVSDFVLAIYGENDEIIKTYPITNHNNPAGAGEVSLYNANWSTEQKIVPQDINSPGEVFVVEDADKALANDLNDFYGIGEITKTSPKQLVEGEFALVSNNEEISQMLKVGTKVRVSRTFTGPFSDIEELAVGHAYLIHEGEESPLLDEMYYYTRAPRTIVGIKEDGTIVLLTIDGRQADNNMFGATQEEMVAIMKHYDCVGAYNLDGGGSTTMIVRKGNTFEVVNNPSDGSARSVTNAIFFVVYDPDFSTENVMINYDRVEIEVKVADHKGVTIKDIYVELDNELKKIENQRVRFDSLTPNTEYIYTIYYENSAGDLIKTVSAGIVNTAKRTGILKDISYEVKNNELIVNVDFYDPDNSITRAQVLLGDKSAYINSGQAIIRNPEQTDDGDYEFIVIYRVDLKNLQGFFEIRLHNPHLKLHNYVDVLVSRHSIKVNNLLK